MPEVPLLLVLAGASLAKTNDQAKVKINVDKNARKTTPANAATFACAAQRRRWRW